jgi:hypothetical protein
MMKILLLLTATLLLSIGSYAQTTKAANNSSDSLLVTIFLKHQQDKNLQTIQEILTKNHFWEMFPPKEARVVSWYVMMGIGQVVTVRIPAKELRTLNLTIERGAWGAFDTEFYPTYDYVPVWQAQQKDKK